MAKKDQGKGVDNKKFYGVVGILIVFALFNLALLVVSLVVLHDIDDNSEHVDKSLYMFVLVGTYASIAASIARHEEDPDRNKRVLLALFGLSVRIAYIYMIRTELRPNHEDLSLSKGQLDFIEYGTYAAWGSALLLVFFLRPLGKIWTGDMSDAYQKRQRKAMSSLCF